MDEIILALGFVGKLSFMTSNAVCLLTGNSADVTKKLVELENIKCTKKNPLK